jgi:hypothetical protein
MKSIIDKRSEFLLKNIKIGQENGMINPNIKGELLEDLISGGSRDICLKWRMSNFSFSLKDRTLEMLDMVLNAFKVNDK